MYEHVEGAPAPVIPVYSVRRDVVSEAARCQSRAIGDAVVNVGNILEFLNRREG